MVDRAARLVGPVVPPFLGFIEALVVAALAPTITRRVIPFRGPPRLPPHRGLFTRDLGLRVGQSETSTIAIEMATPTLAPRGS